MLRHKALLLALLFTLSAWPAFLHAQEGSQDQESEAGSHVRIVRLSYLEGGVQIDNNQGFQNATTNVPITEGDRLLTRSDGWAEVQFEDGGTLRLAPESQVTFSQLGRLADGGTVTAIDLDQGEAEFKLQKHDDSEFAVTARNKTIVLKHSGRFRVTTTNKEPLEVAVFKGEVAISDSVGEPAVTVKKNETFALDVTDFAKYDLEKQAEADDLDEWGRQRDESLSAEAASHNSYTQSPYQYGLNDLNYYGSYYDVPGYGYLWQPNGVGLNWDPFMNGYWLYSPIYGYSWVSAYPWGWMPYRYGQWIFVPNYGWLWQPGGWRYWRRRPFIANTPPGFHPPTPPAISQTAGGQPGTVRMGTLPGRVQSQPPGKKPVFSVGSEEVPRAGAQIPTNRGKRVFTNEQVEGPQPHVDDQSSQASGSMRMERRDTDAKTDPRENGMRRDGGGKTAVSPATSRPSRASGPVMRSEPRPSSAPAPRASQPPPPASPPVPRAAPAPHVSSPRTSAPPAPRMQAAPRPSFSSSRPSISSRPK